MPDKRTTASDFLVAVFGPVSSAPVFLCSLPNADARDREKGERYVLTRDRETIHGHVAKWDRPDRGLFFSVGTLRHGARPQAAGGSPRCKANLAEIVCLHADVDFKGVEIGRDEILARVRALPCPPSVIVFSGRGLHLYWLLNEAIEATDEAIERVEALNAQVADLVGGDAVQDACRLMRVPGTHNTKDGGWTEVEIVEARYEPRYEIGDLEEMLAMMSPVIRRRAPSSGLAGAVQTTNPFLAAAARLGFKPPIDVEQRLAAMAYQGAGDAAIHTTQLAVTAALLTRGADPEETVESVLAATRAAAGEYGARWNWTREDRAIRRMCEDWTRKHPEIARAAAQPRAQARQADRGAAMTGAAEGLREGSTGATLHDIGAERRKRGGTARTAGKGAAPVAIAEGVIETIRAGGGDIALTEGDVWLYEAGVWTACTAGDEQWMRTLIQRGCDQLGHPGDTKIANAAWKRLNESPDLHHRKVQWDAGGFVATTNGLLDLRSRALTPHRPDAWCRAKIGQPYDATASCPTFLRFLDGCFSNLAPAERTAVIEALQEAFGAFLAIKVLGREQRKALFLLGPSRTGKTQVSTVARRLIGEPVASPSVVDISEQFGMEMLHGARAWIRDDAVSEQDRIDPARFKAIVTGETVNVNRKGRSFAQVAFEIPIVLTTNAMPRARDSSDAIYNRALVIEMTNVVEEEEAAAARRALGLPADCVVGEAIAEREGSGILNWALDGLDRLRARGRYDPPVTMRDAVRRFKDDNNPVAAWLSAAAERDPGCKVSRKDLLCSFNGWQRDEQGDEAKAWGGRQFFPKLRPLAPWADLDGEQGHDGERYATGLRLTQAGLRFWDDHRLEPLRNGTKGYSSRDVDVNRNHGSAHEGEEGRRSEF
jgi:P4 family phage/plasmid primase-like protien